MIDTSIYGLINKPQPMAQQPMPFEQAGQMMTIRNLMGQGELQDMQRGELQRGIAEKGQLRDLFARGDVTPEKIMAISPQVGMEYRKSLLEQKQMEAGTKAKEMEAFSKAVSVLKDRLPTVRDDMSYAAYVEQAKQLLGPDKVGQLGLPPRFDPQWVQRQLVESKELFTPKLQVIEMPDGSKKTVDMNPFTNSQAVNFNAPAAMTPNQTATVAATRRGQDMTAATAQRGQNLTDARERDVRLQADIAGAREQGKDIVNARQQLPQAIANAERGMRLIDEMVGSADGKTKAHPGMQSAVGVSMSKLVSPFWAMPGTDRRDFEARLGEIKGGAFLQAFESLKGGGAITQIEGEKATQAITRMETAQSEREFVAAAREFQNIIKGGMARAKAKAGQNPMAPGGTSVMAPGRPGANPSALSDDELRRELGL